MFMLLGFFLFVILFVCFSKTQQQIFPLPPLSIQSGKNLRKALLCRLVNSPETCSLFLIALKNCFGPQL